MNVSTADNVFNNNSNPNNPNSTTDNVCTTQIQTMNGSATNNI